MKRKTTATRNKSSRTIFLSAFGSREGKNLYPILIATNCFMIDWIPRLCRFCFFTFYLHPFKYVLWPCTMIQVHLLRNSWAGSWPKIHNNVHIIYDNCRTINSGIKTLKLKEKCFVVAKKVFCAAVAVDDNSFTMICTGMVWSYFW